MKKLLLLTSVAALVLLYAGCSHKPTDAGLDVDAEIRAQLPSGAKVRATGTKEVAGETFLRVKFELAGEKPGEMFFDSGNKRVKQLPSFARPKIDPRLQVILDQSKQDKIVDVVIVLIDPLFKVEEEAGFAQVSLGKDGEELEFLFNDKPSSLKEIEAVEARRDAYRQKIAGERLERRRERLRTFLDVNEWKQDQAASQALELGATSLRRQIPAGEIPQLAKRSANLIVSIELFEDRYDELASAMASTNVQTWAINNGHRGANIGIYMSEAGNNCPVSPHINNARFTQLSGGAADSHANFVGNILTTVAPQAHIFCGSPEMISNPESQSPRVYVTNQSWGAGTSTSYVGRDRDFDTAVYDKDLVVFKSAGNRGNIEGNVTTPGKAFNVIAVGNYQDNNDSMSSTSSFVDPETNAEKPDLSTPGSSITTTAGTSGGTSYAAPHAAGFAADLLGRYSWLRNHPARVKALMLAGASRNIEGSVRLSEKDGAGGINYLNSGYNGTNTVWWGSNGSHFDASRHVSTTRSFTAGRRYRVALSWVASGSYALSNKNVNMDLDLKIYRPGGGWVTGSYSWDNGFEIVDFTAPVSGTYTIKVHRYWNSGSGKVNMAVHSQRIL